ncbi:MAG: DNA-binding NarL/FixJ family response regulator [Rhodothermales bacterium]|jgi:DNA-binding NarL/FixJ family response regulator
MAALVASDQPGCSRADKTPTPHRAKYTMKPIRVVLADDHPAFREGIAGRLNREPGMEVIGEASNGEGALELTRAQDPDVLVLDLEMPGINGVEVTRRLFQEQARTQVLVLSAYEDEDYIFSVLDAGAAGYLSKQEPLATIVEAVRGIAAGESGWLSRRIAALFVKSSRAGQRTNSGLLRALSGRECEVLQRIAAGDSNQEIGDKLFISESTVKKHANSIYEKLDVATRAQTIAWAWRNGVAEE